MPFKRIEVPEHEPARICIYGASGTGKTTLATSLPWGHPLFGERAVYVALDEGSSGLRPVSDRDARHLLPVKLEGDPLESIIEICRHPWKREDPMIGTIIFDTWTTWAEVILRVYANMLNFQGQKEQIQFGERGSPSFHANPVPGDYGCAQSAHMTAWRWAVQQPLTLISIFHEGWAEPRNVADGQGLRGGPITVGQAHARELPKHYDTVLHTEVQQVKDPENPKRTVADYVVWTRPHGMWTARIRTAKETMGAPSLPRDPRPFWEDYLELYGDVHVNNEGRV